VVIISKPLVKIFTMVNVKKHIMSYLDKTMHRAKAAIATTYGGMEATYKSLWEIIDIGLEH
jgi:hypothetical protein